MPSARSFFSSVIDVFFFPQEVVSRGMPSQTRDCLQMRSLGKSHDSASNTDTNRETSGRQSLGERPEPDKWQLAKVTLLGDLVEVREDARWVGRRVLRMPGWIGDK